MAKTQQASGACMAQGIASFLITASFFCYSTISLSVSAQEASLYNRSGKDLYIDFGYQSDNSVAGIGGSGYTDRNSHIRAAGPNLFKNESKLVIKQFHSTYFRLFDLKGDKVLIKSCAVKGSRFIDRRFPVPATKIRRDLPASYDITLPLQSPSATGEYYALKRVRVIEGSGYRIGRFNAIDCLKQRRCPTIGQPCYTIHVIDYQNTNLVAKPKTPSNATSPTSTAQPIDSSVNRKGNSSPNTSRDCSGYQTFAGYSACRNHPR